MTADAPSPKFAAVIRTQGKRPQPLRDALQSLALQKVACLAVVVVHGDAEVSVDNAIVLRAADTVRRRGYPANVGLDYCLSQSDLEYVCLLDDDDVLYPFFTDQMQAAFRLTGADVIYAASNRCERERGLQPAFPLHPLHHLLNENFIPSNSFAIRVEALRRSNVRFDETLDYLEDWKFLLRLLEAGLRFERLPLTLSEFRIVPDAYIPQRRELDEWKASSAALRAYINRTLFPLPGSALASLSYGSSTISQDARPIDQARIELLQNRVRELERSFSWKVTAPLRSAYEFVLRMRKNS